MKFAGRTVIVSDLDQVPHSLMFGPGTIVLSRQVARAVRQGNTRVRAIVQRKVDAHDRKTLIGALEGRGR